MPQSKLTAYNRRFESDSNPTAGGTTSASDEFDVDVTPGDRVRVDWTDGMGEEDEIAGVVERITDGHETIVHVRDYENDEFGVGKGYDAAPSWVERRPTARGFRSDIPFDARKAFLDIHAPNEFSHLSGSITAGTEAHEIYERQVEKVARFALEHVGGSGGEYHHHTEFESAFSDWHREQRTTGELAERYESAGYETTPNTWSFYEFASDEVIDVVLLWLADEHRDAIYHARERVHQKFVSALEDRNETERKRAEGAEFVENPPESVGDFERVEAPDDVLAYRGPRVNRTQILAIFETDDGAEAIYYQPEAWDDHDGHPADDELRPNAWVTATVGESPDLEGAAAGALSEMRRFSDDGEGGDD